MQAFNGTAAAAQLRFYHTSQMAYLAQIVLLIYSTRRWTSIESLFDQVERICRAIRNQKTPSLSTVVQSGIKSQVGYINWREEMVCTECRLHLFDAWWLAIFDRHDGSCLLILLWRCELTHHTECVTIYEYILLRRHGCNQLATAKNSTSTSSLSIHLFILIDCWQYISDRIFQRKSPAFTVFCVSSVYTAAVQYFSLVIHYIRRPILVRTAVGSFDSVLCFFFHRAVSIFW